MLIILLSVLLVAFLLYVVGLARSKVLYCVAVVFCGIVVAAGLLAGLTAPISGYTGWELFAEGEVKPLPDSTASGDSKSAYVSIGADGSYTYSAKITSEISTDFPKEYGVVIFGDEDVVVMEDADCQKPVVKIYTRQGRKSIWTFALFSQKKMHILNVPEGTILKEGKLK